MKRIVLLFTLLTGCAVAPPPRPVPALATAPTAGAPWANWYREAEAAGRQVMQIDTQHSLIVITVHRGGTLARLGHDHAIASRTISGLIAPDAGRADFQFRLDEM